MAGNPLPQKLDDLVAPPISTRDDWTEGAMTVATYCREFDVGRGKAFDQMRSGDLVWGRLSGRTRRISRKSAVDLFASVKLL